MAARKKTNPTQLARRLQRDLDRAIAGSEELAGALEGALGATVQEHIGTPLADATRVTAALADFLDTMSAVAPAAPKRRPGRPRGEGRKPGRPAKKRGGRRRRADLTAAQIEAALKKAGGVKTRAAKILGVSQPTLYKYMAATSASKSAKN